MRRQLKAYVATKHLPPYNWVFWIVFRQKTLTKWVGKIFEVSQKKRRAILVYRLFLRKNILGKE